MYNFEKPNASVKLEVESPSDVETLRKFFSNANVALPGTRGTLDHVSLVGGAKVQVAQGVNITGTYDSNLYTDAVSVPTVDVEQYELTVFPEILGDKTESESKPKRRRKVK